MLSDFSASSPQKVRMFLQREMSLGISRKILSALYKRADQLNRLLALTLSLSTAQAFSRVQMLGLNVVSRVD